MLLHRFQQCGLRLGRRTVDFVREQHIRKQRPLLKLKEFPSVRCLRDHLSSDQIGRHQVGRKLNPVELQMQRVGQRPHGQSLAEPGNSLQQHVPTGDQCNQRVVQDFFLPHDDL
jgi:hypothetical protein